MGLMGMNKAKELNENEIIELAGKYNIPENQVYEAQKSYFDDLFKNFDSEKYKDEIKNRYQPLQALYYVNDGELVSYHVNCHTGGVGFPNLKWNKDDNFEQFIPKQQADLDELFPLDTLLTYFEPLGNTKEINTAEYDYVVIVFWNRFMGRQSKRLIKFVQKSLEYTDGHKVKVIYVNNDKLMS